MAKQYTFWNLLSEKRIVIPIIQRDYAQGRKDKSYVRKNFLEQLGKALGIACEDENDQIAELDFVYGIESRIKTHDGVELIEMQPLDGQQRLTTLWLLHWYVAFKSGRLFQNEVKKVLINFTYETRTSSREFCESLCNICSNSDSTDIKKFITRQTWFFSAWNQDPTIQAMLRMLEGTDTSKEKDGEYIDGIQELFAGVSDYKQYWSILTKENCSIHFTFLPLQSSELPVSDELYIKMNARGKALTAFENFKADLVDWIYQEKNDDVFGEDEDTQRNGRVQLSSLIDNHWTDIFWDKVKDDKDKYIDDVYFAFLNRFFLNQAIVSDLVKSKQNKIVEGSNLWSLYGETSNDSNVDYRGFSIYASILNSKTFGYPDILSRLQKMFNYISNVNINEYLPQWAQQTYENFKFIPIHTGNGISTLTQPQRVLFYAICQYFEVTEFEESSFKRWMRIVCNLIDNPSVNNIDAMIGRLKLIYKLSPHCINIYQYLAGNETIESDVAREQIAEERLKSIQILHPTSDAVLPEKYADWEEAIIESENDAFYHGAIRFLFLNNQNRPIWKDFQTKSQNSLTYFDVNGINESSYKLLRRLIAYFNCEEDFKQIYFDKNKNSWKNYVLLNKKLAAQTHALLLTNDIDDFEYSNFNSNISDKYVNYLQTYLVKTEILSKMVSDCVYHYRGDSETGCVLYPSNAKADWKKYIINPRLEILIALKKNSNIDFKFKDDNLNKEEFLNAGILWGWNITFYYRNYQFVWQCWKNWVDMYDNDHKLWDIGNELKNKGDVIQSKKLMQLHSHFTDDPEHDKGCYFTDAKSLKEELDRCIREYSEIKDSVNVSNLV